MNSKICYLCSSLKRYDPRIYWRQAQSLVTENFEVSIVVCDNLPDEKNAGIKIISCRFEPKGRFHRFINARKYLLKKALEINADVFQISEPELIPLGVKLKRLNKTVVLDLRENYPTLILSKPYIPKVLRRLVSLLLRNYMKSKLALFDLVITVTPSIVEDIRKTMSYENVKVVTNYPIIDKNYEPVWEDYLSRGISMIYAGTAYTYSRQEVVLKALENIPDIKYIIAGIIDEKYKSELERLPFWNKVVYINGIEREDLMDLYKKSTIGNALRDFLAETGSNEGSLGVIKIFEYMEAGLPIICSDVKLWKDMVDKYNCGIYVDPNDADQIAEAVKFLINNELEAFKMGQNGRRAVFEEYNWESQSSIYISLIKSVCDSSGQLKET